MAKLLQYYVEGECEEKIINAFQHEEVGFLAGKIDVINPAKQSISKLRISQLKKDTIVVLVYDTDAANEKILNDNVRLLKQSKNVKAIYHVQSVNNFEDEIVYATNISNINDVFKTKGVNEFKKQFIAHKDIVKKLNNISFDIKLIWSRDANNLKSFINQGDKIKRKTR